MYAEEICVFSLRKSDFLQWDTGVDVPFRCSGKKLWVTNRSTVRAPWCWRNFELLMHHDAMSDFLDQNMEGLKSFFSHQAL